MFCGSIFCSVLVRIGGCTNFLAKKGFTKQMEMFGFHSQSNTLILSLHFDQDKYTLNH